MGRFLLLLFYRGFYSINIKKFLTNYFLIKQIFVLDKTFKEYELQMPTFVGQFVLIAIFCPAQSKPIKIYRIKFKENIFISFTHSFKNYLQFK